MSTRFANLRAFLAGESSDGTDGDDTNAEDIEDGADGEDGDDADGDQGDDVSDDTDAGDDGDDADAGEEDAGGVAADAGSNDTLTERRRWATVLSHENSEGRIEAACSMLVEDMSAGAIIRTLGTLPKENSASRRLASTPSKKLGSGNGAGKGGSDKDAAATARKNALSQVNSRHGRGRGRADNITSANRKTGRNTED